MKEPLRAKSLLLPQFPTFARGAEPQGSATVSLLPAPLFPRGPVAEYNAAQVVHGAGDEGAPQAKFSPFFPDLSRSRELTAWVSYEPFCPPHFFPRYGGARFFSLRSWESRFLTGYLRSRAGRSTMLPRWNTGRGPRHRPLVAQVVISAKRAKTSLCSPIVRCASPHLFGQKRRGVGMVATDCLDRYTTHGYHTALAVFWPTVPTRREEPDARALPSRQPGAAPQPGPTAG